MQRAIYIGQRELISKDGITLIVIGFLTDSAVKGKEVKAIMELKIYQQNALDAFTRWLEAL